ncbi:MAG: glycosyltransferase, partial [Paludibacteraceae bacterium]|nr:glycosyltransferase [Paludibacteraceae bacterium]
VYTIMACGKPLLVSSGQGTPIINFLQPLDCAKLITEHDPQIKVDQMAEWLSNVSREELQTMGQRGISVIQQIYSKEVVTAQYVNLVDNMLKQ